MNDPRITAYAVGELEPADRESFERELATSTDLQRELAETVQLAEALPTALSDDGDGLDDVRRAAIVAKASEKTNRSPVVRVWLPALAACLIAVLALITLQTQPRGEAPVIAYQAPEIPQSAPVRRAQPVDSIDTTAGTRSDGTAEMLITMNREREEVAAGAAVADKNDPRVAELPPIGDFVKNNMREQIRLQRSAAPVPQASPIEERTVVAKNEARQVTSGSEVSVAQAPAEASQIQSELKEMPATTTGNKDARLVGGATAQPVGGETLRTLDKAKEPQATTALPYGVAVAGVPTSANLDVYKQTRGTVLTSDFDTEAYDSITPNEFLTVKDNPLSTFSIDVDTASYANVRRFLNDGNLPPAGAVRIEELINYFPYDLPQPEGDVPFSITTDVTNAPWKKEHLLARIALKGRDIEADKLPPSNLVFLVDVSGSMQPEDKLPLLKRALRGLVERLSPRDSVAMVVYAGSSGLVLSPTDGNEKPAILEALDRLEAGGSTNGASGIQLAYDTARQHFLKEGNNRVILCTDGDFNVGVTSQSELVDLIERERKSGVFLSVLGFGTGNVKDSTMEKLADKGNGNYAYIDSTSEARKVLVEQMGATLFTIAKDVKIQVEFNPATVAGYRLIGYENRLLAKEDFNDDTKDAGEIGAGHNVTALYEIVPAGQKLPNDRSVDPLKYQSIAERSAAINEPISNDLFTVKLRYKQPDGDTSKLIEKPIGNEVEEFDSAPEDFRFATAVAGFGMTLRGGETDAKMDLAEVQKIARGSLGNDPGSYRAEFLTLVEKAKALTPGTTREQVGE